MPLRRPFRGPSGVSLSESCPPHFYPNEIPDTQSRSGVFGVWTMQGTEGVSSCLRGRGVCWLKARGCACGGRLHVSLAAHGQHKHSSSRWAQSPGCFLTCLTVFPLGVAGTPTVQACPRLALRRQRTVASCHSGSTSSSRWASVTHNSRAGNLTRQLQERNLIQDAVSELHDKDDGNRANGQTSLLRRSSNELVTEVRAAISIHGPAG